MKLPPWIAAVALLAAAPRAEASAIYFTTQTSPGLETSALTGGTVTSLESLGNPYGIAVDAAANKLYWADNGADAIQRAALTGGTVTNVTTGLTTPLALTIDIPGAKAYWADRDSGKIQSAPLAGGAPTDIITGISGILAGYGIALDAAGGRVYWTESGTGKIRKSSGLTGGSTASDFLTGLNNPQALAFDPYNRRFYFGEQSASGSRISRVDADGTGLTPLWTLPVDMEVYGIALDVGAGMIYWTEYSGHSIQRAAMDGSGSIATVLSGLSDRPTGLALDVPAPVPEPGLAALLVLGAGATLARRQSLRSVHSR